MASGCNFYIKICKEAKIAKIEFFPLKLKSNTLQDWFYWSICSHIMHASHIGITQRPHDHLYQKSGHLGAIDISKLVRRLKSQNLSFFI